MSICLHIDDQALLREAIFFTARETGFNPRLVEKDYFCSVVLEYLAASGADLTFKGDTCLSKIHRGFYRLSEDLDFSISTPVGATRTDRSRSAAQLKTGTAALPLHLPTFRIREPLAGANNSMQYNAVMEYVSLIDGHLEPVSIEVGVREPNLTDVQAGAAKTALLDPVSGRALVDAFAVRCLSYSEAMAEKFRAALCRSEVAIRDFFDVEYATQFADFDARAPAFLELLRQKIVIPRTGQVDVSDVRMEQVRRQLGTQLRPVLREQEFARFDLEQAIATVRRVAQELASS